MTFYASLLYYLQFVSGTQFGAMAAYGNLDVVKFLTSLPETNVSSRDNDGRTPLGAAAANGHLEIVKYLTSLPETNIDSQDDKGGTPLILSASNNHPKVVEFLLQKGADASIKDNAGKNALDWATSKDFANVVNVLFNGWCS